MEDGIAMAPYSIAASDAGELVIGGEDDAYDLVNGQAAVASSADDWTIHVLGTGDSQVSGLTRAGDGFAATGYLVESAGEVLGSMVATSADGIDWTITEPRQLKHGTVTAGIDAAGDLVVVSGSRYDARKDRTVPIVLWGRASEESPTHGSAQAARPQDLWHDRGPPERGRGHGLRARHRAEPAGHLVQRHRVVVQPAGKAA